MATPIKFLRASIGGVSVKSTATSGGDAGVPYQWNATLTVVAQAHSDPTSTPVANYYTGRNVVVGDWITSDASGKALKIASITSQTDTSVVCVLQDVDYINALSDETGNLDGMIPNGAGIGAYIFSVKNNVPILGNIPASLPGNLAGSDFVNNIQSRFASTATVGISDTTGKLDASILPTPVVGGAPGAVKLATGGAFSVDTNGNLELTPTGVTAGKVGNVTVDEAGRVTAIVALTAADVPNLSWSKITSGIPTTLAGLGVTDGLTTSMKGAANGLATLDGTGRVPASQLPSFVDDVEEYAEKINFPVAGEAGKIYVALDTNTLFRWSGSAYIEIVAAPGSTDAVAEGSTNLYFTDARAQAAVAAGAPTVLNSLAKVAAALNGDPNAYSTLTSLMDTKIATAITNLTGGASASLNSFADVEAALTAETATREAADLAMQATIDALFVADIDGGEF